MHNTPGGRSCYYIVNHRRLLCPTCSAQHERLPAHWQELCPDHERRWCAQRLDAHPLVNWAVWVSILAYCCTLRHTRATSAGCVMCLAWLHMLQACRQLPVALSHTRAAENTHCPLLSLGKGVSVIAPAAGSSRTMQGCATLCLRQTSAAMLLAGPP